MSERDLVGSGTFLVSGSEPAIQAAIAKWLEDRGAPQIVCSNSEDLAATLAGIDASRASTLAGWVHVVPEAARGELEIERLAPALGKEGIGFCAVVSVRSEMTGDASIDRAWETRSWIDRLLLSDAARRGRVSTFSVASPEGEACARRVAGLVGRALLGGDVDASHVDFSESELRSLLSEPSSPLLSLLPAPECDRSEPTLLRSEWMGLKPPERRIAMQQFVCGALGDVLGLSREQRESIDVGCRIDELGLDSLMTLELFLGLARDLELEIGADWFAASPTLSEVARVLLERLEDDVPEEKAE